MRRLLLIALAACGHADANDATPEAVAEFVDAGPATEEPMGRLRRLRPSTSLVSPPTDTADVVVVTPASYASWAALFAGTSAQTIRLSAGNYESWGTPSITTTGGTSIRPRVIRFDGDAHPLHRATEALVVAPQCGDGAEFWYFHGLTFRSGTLNATGTSHHIYWDSLLGEGTTGEAAVRILNGGSVWLQRSVIRSPGAGAPVDAVAVQIKGVGGGGMSTVRILDNELYDFSDALAITDDATDPWAAYDDVLIEGNHGHVTSAKYNGDGTATTENLVDVKAGSSYAAGITFRQNIWRGTRKTLRGGESTSDGTAMVFHRYARNILVDGDIVADAPGGIQELAWPAGEDPSAARTIVFRDVQAHDIGNYSGSDRGAVFRLLNNHSVTRTVAARCRYFLYTHAALVAGGPTFIDNLRIRTETYDPSSVAPNPYVEGNNAVVEWSGPFDRYEWKRWTGPEVALGAVNMPTTYKLIRERQISVVKALTPSLLPSLGRFTLVPDHEFPDFESWCDNAGDPFRVFEVRHGLDYEGEGEVPGTDTSHATHTQELLVVYPRLQTMHGDRVEYVIDEDLTDITQALGIRGYANYEALGTGLHKCLRVGSFLEERPSCRILHLRFSLDYDRSI